MSLERRTSEVVWELRGAWARRRRVRLVLSDRCMVKIVIGTVSRMSVTGAFVVIDGWEIPCEDILSVARPTVEETEVYERIRELEIEPEDLIIDTVDLGFDQPVHVKVTHRPTGKVAEAQERSQLRARETAMRELRRILRAQALEDALSLDSLSPIPRERRHDEPLG